MCKNINESTCIRYLQGGLLLCAVLIVAGSSDGVNTNANRGSAVGVENGDGTSDEESQTNGDGGDGAASNSDAGQSSGSSSDVNTGSETGTGTDTGTETNTDNDGEADGGTNSDNDAPGTDTPDFGEANAAIDFIALQFISEHEVLRGYESDANARYYKVASALDASVTLQTMSVLDSCSIGSAQSTITNEFLDLPIDHVIESSGNSVLQVTSVSAGEAVEIASTAGSHFALSPVTNTAGDTEYTTGDSGAMPLLVPEQLTTTNTGNEFAMISAQWTKPQAVNRELRAAVRSVSENPILQWDAVQAVENTQSRLHVYAGYIDELTGDFQSFECQLEDDGEFALPEDIQALYDDGFSANFVSVGRYTRSLQFIDNTAFVSVFLQTR